MPAIIDTDMAGDDWMAILFLLQRPDVNVIAITVTGTGEAHCGPGIRHALDLVLLAGRPKVPVTCGHEMPVIGNHAFPME
jgi:pyrimidine-specific ribonucleoside hydrolase